MRLHIFSLSAMAAALFVSYAHAGGHNDPIVPATEELCPTADHADLLSCLNSWYSDLLVESVPLSLDTGSEFPELGGIFSTLQRTKRAGDGSEMVLGNISGENLAKLRAIDDPANAYRVLSASPTAKNLFLSLDLLAHEVLPQAPVNAPLAFLFLTKVIESTLYAAATEDEREIYAATEQFRNCVFLTLVDHGATNLRSECMATLRATAEMVATSEASSDREQ